MTDATADAAKLLPKQIDEAMCVARRWLDDGKHGKITNLLCRAVLQLNTSPQPAPPAEEPDFKVIAKDILSKLHLRIQSALGKGPIKEYPPSHSAIALVERKLIESYRLGLAARPKVEDAEVTDIVLLMLEKIETLEADIRTKETQLAQADANIARADAFMRTQRGVRVAPSKHGCWEEALARHQSRQDKQ